MGFFGIGPAYSQELENAVYAGHTELVEALLKKEGRLNKKFKCSGFPRGTDHKGETSCHDYVTLLILAAWKGHADVVRVLIRAGANIHTKSRGGYTVMDAARGKMDTIKVLLDAGMSVRNSSGKTGSPIVYAGSRQMVELLLSKGSNIDDRGNERGNSLLHNVVLRHGDDYRFTEYLISMGANVNIKNKFGITPLMWAACGYNKFQTTKVLLENGAEINTKDKDGKAALGHVFKNHYPNPKVAKYGAKC